MENKKRSWAYLVYRLVGLFRPHWLAGKEAGRELGRAAIEASEEIHPDDASTNGTMRSIRHDWLGELRTGFNERIDAEIGE